MNNDIEELFKQHLNISKVSKLTGISKYYVQQELFKKYNCNSIKKLKRILGIHKQPPLTLKEKILKAKTLYDELHTLEKTGKVLGLTRERIRQLLNLGQKYNLFKFNPYRKVRINQLKNLYTKDHIINEIRTSGSLYKICQNLKITMPELKTIIKHHNINTHKYLIEHRINRCLNEYINIVNELGHHPTATELSKKNTWRNLWMNIYRYWGSLNNFRKEYNIQIPEKSLNAKFKEFLQKKIALKHEKIEKILQLLKEHNQLTRKEIEQTLNISTIQTIKYLKELISTGKIKKLNSSFPPLYTLQN